MTKRKLNYCTRKYNFEEAKEIFKEHKIEKLPLVDKDGILKRLNNYKGY